MRPSPDAVGRRKNGAVAAGKLRPPKPPLVPLEFLSRSWSASGRAFTPPPPTPPPAALVSRITEDAACKLEDCGVVAMSGSSFSFASAAKSQLIMERILLQSVGGGTGGLAGRRSILPVPPPRPAGQRPRKKMRLPEIQQLVRSLSVENDALREEMKALQRACTALSKENGKLEIRLDHSSKRNGIISAEDKGKPKPAPQEAAAEQDAGNGFVLPDLNLPADD